MPYHPSNVSSSRRLPPSSSSNMSSKLQMISTAAPPLNSVYTKGTHGAVKAKPHQQPQQRSSALPQHLQSHQHHYQQAQRRTPRSEERHRTQQPKHNTSISSRQHQQQQQPQHYNTTRSSFTTTTTTTTRTIRRRRSHSPTTTAAATTTTTTPSSTTTTRSLRGAYNVVLATSTSTPTSIATPSQQPPPPPSFLESRGTISDHGSVSSLGSLSRRTPPIVRDDSSSQRSNRSVTFGGIITTTTTTTSSSTNQQNENNSINSNKPIFQTLQDLHKQHLRTTRRIIDELNRPHNSYERRVAAISVACETFDHTDESLHNIELHHGAAQALAKLLMHTNRDDEIRMLCAALEMVLRGNAKSVQTAMEKMTQQQQQLPSLLSHLLRLLQRCERGQLKYAVVCAISIHRIVLYWSRCPRLRATLARQVGLLDVLTNKSSSSSSSSSRNKSKNNDSPTSSPSDYSLHDECRIARIRTIANLARCDENKVLLLEEGNHQVLEYTVRVAYKDVLEDVRHYAAIALMEFASAAANQKVMADSEATLSALVTLIFNEEKNAGTREYAITAIQNLAFAKTNRVRLVTFKDGMVLKALIDALSTDPDDKARRRAAGALTNLACEETSGLIGSYKGLLNSLGMVTLKDKNKEVQTRAALALTKIANGITVHMSCHDTLLDALVTASLSDVATSISAVLRVKARAVENRESMARHGGVLDTLCDICMSDKSAIADRDNAVRTIMHLVNEDKNRKIMCNKSILEALVASADYKDPDLSDARDSAIRALERLGTEYSNRPVMARHKGLLVTVSKAVEREAQWEEEGKKTEYGYLAKPLLMSLLLAM